jgi:hypothetical protein
MSKKECLIPMDTIFVCRYATNSSIVDNMFAMISVILASVNHAEFTQRIHFGAHVELLNLIHLLSAISRGQLVINLVRKFFHADISAQLPAILEIVLHV